MSANTFHVSEAYAPRPSRFEGLTSHAGWSVKRYRIWHGALDEQPGRFADGVTAALKCLEPPGRTATRPGVAILIEHQGKAADYVVLARWERENELPIRVWVRDELGWRPAGEDESFCVWDLELLWRERELYVEHVLADPLDPGVDAYVATSAAATEPRR